MKKYKFVLEIGDKRSNESIIVMFKAFETMEFSVFIDVMGWARDEANKDIEVKTCGFEKTVLSTFGVPIVMDKTIDEVCTDTYDALAILM